MPAPAVAPSSAGTMSDPSNRKASALARASALRAVISSGYTEVSTAWFIDEKPPCAAQISAASGVARYCRNAMATSESLNATATSPPPITEGGDPSMLGKGKKSKSVPAAASVSPRMTPATKSPS